ncbi:MAG: protein BatD [Chitinophagaceae bacterium]|nr:protein BatD [Chitinophagaceae bacterium]
MRLLVLSLLSLFIRTLGVAQEIVFITQPAADKVGTEDAFDVRFVIKNASQVTKFSLPEMNDLQILGGPSRSTNMTIMNGQRSMSLELTYTMKARRAGKVTIPGAVATADGQNIRSNPVTIEVVQGSVVERRQRGRDPFGGGNPFDDPFFDDPFGGDPFAAMQQHQQQIRQMMQQQMQRGGMQQIPPQARPGTPEIISKKDLGNNLFIRVDVDKRTAVIGEQITASYKMYTRVPMEINLTKLPSLVGFWSQDFKIPQPPKPVREVVNGKEYQVFEIKRTALFPTQTGTLQLDPAEAEGKARLIKPKRVRQDQPGMGMFDDDPFFKSFFGSMLMSDPNFDEQFQTIYDYEDVPVALKSVPINITVTDVPVADRPASYKGAVGKYTLESNIDKTELSTDDAAIITLRVSGTGNLKLIGTPELKIPQDLEAYDPQVNDTITNTNNIIAGYKTFAYTITPRIAGTFMIPAAEFTYYDPESKSFKTLYTPAYTLHVKPGKGDASVSKLPRDIHDIHAKPITIRKSQESPVWKSPVYWGGFALPLLAYFGLVFYKRKEDELQSNLTLFKNKRANKVALKRLALAEKFLKQNTPTPFYEETSKAVWLYLSDKLNIPLSQLNKELAAEKLLEKNTPPVLQKEVFRITQECEMALYAPDHGSLRMHQTYMEAVKLIGNLEDCLA